MLGEFRYLCKPNYCCGDGDWVEIKGGQVALDQGGVPQTGMDVFDAVRGEAVEDWCGRFYHCRNLDQLRQCYPELDGWMALPDWGDGVYRWSKEGGWSKDES